ncbi:MAG: hypothetical protein ABFS05_05455 [Bacteroidota bacterium]
MKRDQIKVIGIVLVIALFSSHLSAQVAINTSGDNPENCAMLDVNSDTSGILLPRVSLVALNDSAPINSVMVDGLLVYNIATSSDLTPGLYIWRDTTWLRANFSNETHQRSFPETSYFPSGEQDSYIDAYIYCQDLIHDGYNDWRLPSLTEAEVLYEQGEFGSEDEFLWTTTPAGEGIALDRKNMLLNPDQEERKLLPIGDSYRFRCVR